MSGPCPVCFEEVPVSLLEAHVNGHFGDEAAVPDGSVRCVVCGCSVSSGELDSHELAHSFERDTSRPAAGVSGGEAADVVDLTSDGEGEARPQKMPRSDGDLSGGGLRDVVPSLLTQPLWPRIPLHLLLERQQAEPTNSAVDWHLLLRRALAAQVRA
jgi:hypothetical protein